LTNKALATIRLPAPIPLVSLSQAIRRSSIVFRIPILRNVVEYLSIVLLWGIGLASVHWFQEYPIALQLVILLICFSKAVFFGRENLNQLYDAARSNLSHHHFLLLMAINMSQMILSFTFDFHLLYLIDQNSFAGIVETASFWESLFDFFYLSTLNFSFFGYSEILPQTVIAKCANLTEIVLAFITVIFLLSDFVSLKDSLRSGHVDKK
jgi:hypothetical protein